MGLVFIDGLVQAADGAEMPVSFFLDSGISHSLLPLDVWRGLGLEPNGREQIHLMDGSAVSRNLSECVVVLPQGEAFSTVFLGEEEDKQALLGIETLAKLGLVLNPFNRLLQPARH